MDFCANHGLVLVDIAKHPQTTGQTIASAVNLTKRTVHKIIAEPEAKAVAAHKGGAGFFAARLFPPGD